MIDFSNWFETLRAPYEQDADFEERSGSSLAEFRLDILNKEVVFLRYLFAVITLTILMAWPLDPFWLTGKTYEAFFWWRTFGVFILSSALIIDYLFDMTALLTRWIYIGIFGISLFGSGYIFFSYSKFYSPYIFSLLIGTAFVMPVLSTLLIGLRLRKRIIVAMFAIFCPLVGMLLGMLPGYLSGTVNPPIAVYLFALIYDTAVAMISIFMGHFVHLLYKYSFFLSKDLEAEKQRSDELLLNILPEEIAGRLKDSNEMIADGFDEATVLFADIVEFTPLAEELKPSSVVMLLDDIFSSFDQLIEDYPVEKIKTIGDEYFITSGVPKEIDNHAGVAAELALEMQEIVSKYKREADESFEIRIGMNTGPVVAGVIGTDKFVYDVWGDTVNVGSRMESQGKSGKIQITADTKNAIEEQCDGGFDFEERGTLQVKGKGRMTTYFLEKI